MPKQFGVIGYPVKHSMSPQMFEAAFFEYDIDAEYKQYEVSPDDLKDFIKSVRAEGLNGDEFGGLSVTIPHKTSIGSMLSSVDDHAKAIGAVNTIVVKSGGKLRGYNTDWLGAKKALEDHTELEGRDVVVLGAGGAAAAVTYACVSAGARVTVLNRNASKAEKLAAQFGCEAGPLNDLFQHRCDVLVHTTSIGMHPNERESLVDPDFFKRGMVVFDIVYNPMETRLVRDAKRAGCKIIPGYKMLLYQGEKQFELWFDKKPRTEAMEEALLANLK
ncbi:shikimate dehydrogenase [Pseudomonadota bacterium]